MMPLGESVKGEIFIKNEQTGEYNKLGKVKEIKEIEGTHEDYLDALRYSFEGLIKSVKKVEKTFLEFGGSLTTNFTFKKISRKRLKKLLMANGIQRNEAEQICKDIWIRKKCYSEFDLFFLGDFIYEN